MRRPDPIPQGMHTLTPNLVLSDCSKAIEFYKRALGAKEISRMPAPDGKSIWHAELRIGDSTFFLNDEMPGMGQAAPSPEAPAQVSFCLYVEDCDAAFQRAVAAGGEESAAPEDMFWGDRWASIADPYGYVWAFATRQQDMTEEEIRRAGEAFAKARLAENPDHQGA